MKQDYCVNDAWKGLFCQRNRTMEMIPPTQDALLQHCKRVYYQAGIWYKSNIAQQELPSPEDYGWSLSTVQVVFQWLQKHTLNL